MKTSFAARDYAQNAPQEHLDGPRTPASHLASPHLDAWINQGPRRSPPARLCEDERLSPPTDLVSDSRGRIVPCYHPSERGRGTALRVRSPPGRHPHDAAPPASSAQCTPPRPSMPEADSPTTPAIVLDGVSKAFGANVVLDEVSLTVSQRSIMVMLGPSGTGKSVLLRCLVGLLRPDKGRVMVFGEDVASLDAGVAKDRQQLFRIRRRFGMLFQDGALFDDMTVGENVAFPMRMHTSMSAAEIRASVDDKLRRVGLPKATSKFPSELSGGMRKRVAFARAIALEPDIVLCDEPSSGLDPVMAATLDELILELHKTLGMTFVVITHDTAEARTIADTIGLLSRGKLVTYGPTDEVLRSNHPALRQFFARSTEGPIQVL